MSEIEIRDYVDTLFRAHSGVHELEAKALEKAERDNAAHFILINGLQAKLDRQAETFATKEDLKPLVGFQNRLVGLGIGLTILSAVISALVTAVLMLLLRT